MIYRGWFITGNRAKKGNQILINESERDLKMWIDQIELEEAQRKIRDGGKNAISRDGSRE